MGQMIKVLGFEELPSIFLTPLKHPHIYYLNTEQKLFLFVRIMLPSELLTLLCSARAGTSPN
jgi:hypothetical protein